MQILKNSIDVSCAPRLDFHANFQFAHVQNKSLKREPQRFKPDPEEPYSLGDPRFKQLCCGRAPGLVVLGFTLSFLDTLICINLHSTEENGNFQSLCGDNTPRMRVEFFVY